MLALFVADSAAGGAGNVIDLNGLVTGGVGGAIILGLVYIVRIVADRAIPSRADKRGDLAIVLETLNNTVKMLQEDKKADSDALARKQARIEELEQSAEADFDRIRVLRVEVIELTERLAQKDRVINALVAELRKLGAQVGGLDMDRIEIVHSTEEVRRIRTEVVDSDATQQR